MARTPRFGRSPRIAPDVSAALVAMMREYEAQRERNIVDAWKNGGEFEGKKATDEALLKFFADKMAGLDPSDPLYTEAKNTRGQYEFAVRNSKQELSYAQGKVSDGGMATFYANEARKHPVNSEMYRSLMKLSAQYRDRANTGRGGSGGGGGRSKSDKAARDARIETPRGSEFAWNTMSEILLDLARRRGIVNSGQSIETATETTGEGFGDLQVWQGDFGAMQDLIDEFATSPEFAQDRANLTAYIRKYGDPKFDGNFTLEGFMQMRASAQQGITQRLNDAMQNGTKTQTKALQKSLSLVQKAGSALSVVDPMAQYEEARENWERVWGDPKASPIDKWQATYEFRNEVAEVWTLLDQMAVQAQGSDGGWSSVHAGRALNEWRALGGDSENIGPTLWEESRGHVVGLSGSAEGSDAFTTAQDVSKFWGQVSALAEDPENYVIAKVDANGQPTTAADNYEFAVVPKGAVEAAGIPLAYIGTGEDKMDLPTPDGKTTQVDLSSALQVVYGQKIVTSPVGGLGADGRPTRSNFEVVQGARTDIGAVFTFPDGTRIYQVTDASGVKRFTTTAPWADGIGAVESTNADGDLVVSWVADPGFGITKYNPNQVLDPVYNDPNAANEMTNSVFKSAFLAYTVAKDYFGYRTAPNEKTLDAALKAEAGGDENVFQTLKAEAAAYNTRQAANNEAEAAFMARQGQPGEGAIFETASERAAIRLATGRGGDPDSPQARSLAILAAGGGYFPMGVDRTGAAVSQNVKSLLGEQFRRGLGAAAAGQTGAAPVTGQTVVVGYKDDGRPIYGPAPTLMQGAPGAVRPTAPAPPKPTAPGSTGGGAGTKPPKPTAPPPPKPPPPSPPPAPPIGNYGLTQEEEDYIRRVPPPPPPPEPPPPLAKPGQAPVAS